MMIIWGTKTTRKRLGRIADYCPFCDDARVCDVTETRSVGHLYYLPLGRGKVVGWEGRCRVCRAYLIADETAVRPIKASRRATVEDLVDETNPTLIDRMAAQLDRADRLAAGHLSPADRVAMMYEPLLAVAALIEKRAQAVHFDRWSVASLFGWAVLPLAAMVVIQIVESGNASDLQMGLAAIIGVVIAAVYTVYLLATDVRRFVKRRYRELLARRLAPLDPTEDELQQLTDHLGRGGATKARKALRPARVLRWIEEYSTKSDRLDESSMR